MESKVGDELVQMADSRNADPTNEEVSVASDVLTSRWEGLARRHWRRVMYKDAIDALREAVDGGRAQFEHQPSYNEGLQAEHERFLAAHYGKGSPVFITNYPRVQKPFYMSPSQVDGQEETVDCFDLLVPDLCELVGGSMREHRSSELVAAMQRSGMRSEEQSDTDDSTSLEWYVDLRRHGSVPHGGFGLGFDRLISYLSGVSNVRDVVAFPRWHGRCYA